ncbi:hypothetical protein SAMD00019534_032210 [Acytostelium subglobosum LB1]|uniref:hypothetical protein n=1 Tax=Acytostelium subglobosum LB1 TaxID=1410327 RepID=UPI0006449270|nr:hypothetical protein SAMD00019534_032210 [Acytostelium subglobosum LB1]GAM20046.1 hypothetical protein SAMD00019534_032210 [Acytostelium subglobosum LB1]|eukprot:XP_012756808.1 hypothetical protein SAMD00019534_032210 [Acytostelium subglobosum LB1]
MTSNNLIDVDDLLTTPNDQSQAPQQTYNFTDDTAEAMKNQQQQQTQQTQQQQQQTSPSSQTSQTSQTSPASSSTTENIKYRLLFEYKKLSEIMIRGLYVIPSTNSLFEWHCVLFVRNRIYRSSVIRFVVIIPDDFPDACPAVKFQTPVFHPLIGMDGEIDLSHHFHDWSADKHLIAHVLCYIKSIFHNPDRFEYPPLNAEASRLMKEDYEEFLRRVSHFVKLSIDNIYENPQHTPIVFSPVEEWPDKQQLENTRNTVLKKEVGILDNPRVRQVLSFFSK